MTWISALSALARLVLAVIETARDERVRGAGRTQAIAEAATHAFDEIHAARDVRRDAAARDADPDRLRDDDGYGRPD